LKRPAATTKSPKTVDEYVAGAPKDTRAALTKLRKLIKGAAPRATEGISYGIVGYKYNGKPLAGFGYWQDHYALYGSNERFLSAAERKRSATGKGTLRFTPDSPLPARLVTKIMKARLAEIDES
jgi:uncharacterized protein YdhG (YjbR/CyaY superfamily)